MFENYGDRNFFEYGVLIDTEHSDTEFPVLYCMPYPDEENKYQCAKLYIDITDDWIDREKVCDFVGEDSSDYPEKDPTGFAVACLDYYGPEEFGAYDCWPMYNWAEMTKEDVLDAIKYEPIDYETVDIE